MYLHHVPCCLGMGCFSGRSGSRGWGIQECSHQGCVAVVTVSFSCVAHELIEQVLAKPYVRDDDQAGWPEPSTAAATPAASPS